MKIVLNNKEFKEMETFVHNYARTTAKAYVALDPEEKELLEKTDNQLAGEMFEGIKGFVVLDKSDDNYVVEVSSELVSTYISGVNKIHEAISDYTDDLIQILTRHRGAIVYACEKVKGVSGNKFLKKLASNVIDTIVSHLGLEGLYSDLCYIVKSMKNDYALDMKAREVEEELNKVLLNK